MEGLFRLVRILPEGSEMQIAPSMEEDSLILMGRRLAADHPELSLAVFDPDNKMLWKSEDTPNCSGDVLRGNE